MKNLDGCQRFTSLRGVVFCQVPWHNNFDKKEVNMGKIIHKLVVKRKPGHLYYVDGKGNICEAVMARGGRKKKAAKKKRR